MPRQAPRNGPEITPGTAFPARRRRDGAGVARFVVAAFAGWLAIGLSVPGATTAARAAVGEERAREAAAALHRNLAERAVQLYTEALADTALPNERRAALHNDRGVANARLNLVKAAIDDFNRSVQLFPENASAYNNRGNVLLGAGLTTEAAKDFDRAIVLAPGYAAAYANRASAFAMLGQNEAAIRDFTQASKLSPNNPAPLAGRGRLVLAQNRPFAALRDLNRAIAADTRFGPGYRTRADIKLDIGRYEDAVDDLSKAITFDPTNLELYVARGHAWLAARNTASAIRDFAQAAEIDTKSVSALTGLGIARATAETYDDALNELARAIELDQRSARAYAWRAIVYKRLSQPDLGQRDLDRAARLDANAPEVAYARAELAEAAGRTEDAVRDYRQALARMPHLHGATVALERLGATPVEETEIRELTFEGWRVFLRRGRHHALHPDLGPKVSIPLETLGGAQPQIVAWTLKQPPHKGYGVLTYQAGRVERKEGAEDVEIGVVLDMQAKSVLALETMREGSRFATWTWDDSKLTISGLDGHQEEYRLRTQVAQPAPDRRRNTSEWGQDTPFWAPWSQQQNSGSEPRRRTQPKSLFDLLFKN